MKFISTWLKKAKWQEIKIARREIVTQNSVACLLAEHKALITKDVIKEKLGYTLVCERCGGVFNGKNWEYPDMEKVEEVLQGGVNDNKD